MMGDAVLRPALLSHAVPSLIWHALAESRGLCTQSHGGRLVQADSQRCTTSASHLDFYTCLASILNAVLSHAVPT